jgi:hypothetical protein
MGSGSFFTKLVIIFFIVAALIGLMHMGGRHSAIAFLMKMHGSH